MELLLIGLFCVVWLAFAVDGYLFLRDQFTIRSAVFRHVYMTYTTKNGHDRPRSTYHVIIGNILLPIVQLIILIGFAYAIISPTWTVPTITILTTQAPIVYPLISRWWMHEHMC